MPTLSELRPITGGHNSTEFTATGTIAAGKPVILNSSGTVSQITGSTSAIDASYGDVDVIQEATGGSQYSISTDPFNTGKFIVGFEDKRSGQSEKPMVVVGTTSGSTVTFGTPVAIHSSSAGGNGTVVQFDPTYENRVLVSYYAPSTGSSIGSLTLNGTAVTINSGAAQFYSSNGGKMDPGQMAFDTTKTGYFIAGYTDSAQTGYYRGGSVAANGTVTLNSQVTIMTHWYIHQFSVRCNKSGKFIISGSKASGGSPYCSAAIATMDNSRNVTLGTFYTWNSYLDDRVLKADWDPNDDTKFIVGGAHSGSPYPSKVYVATVDGTAISYGSATQFFDEDIPQKSLIRFNPNPTSTGEFAIIYHETGLSPNLQMRVARCSYTGTTITVHQTYSIYTENGYNEVTAEFDISTGVLYIVNRYDNASSAGNPNWGRLWKVRFANKPTNLTATNLIGVADEGITNDATFVVTVGGGKFVIDGVSQDTLTLEEGATYTFDQAAATNANHPLRFSTTSNGTHGGGSEYTTGVTTNGTPGSAGAYTRIAVASAAPTLYYYCSNHSGMGGTANTPVFTGTLTVNTWGSVNDTQSGMTIGSDYYAQHDGTITTTNTDNLDQQLLGKAISATKLNIKDYTG